jgi:hypothetical protein
VPKSHELKLTDPTAADPVAPRIALAKSVATAEERTNDSSGLIAMVQEIDRRYNLEGYGNAGRESENGSRWTAAGEVPERAASESRLKTSDRAALEEHALQTNDETSQPSPAVLSRRKRAAK